VCAYAALQVPSGCNDRRARRGRGALHPGAGREASFKGYRGFPGSICASPNSMVVHGIPGPYELKRGDVISLDVGVT
jgi:Methionine aminopeptidase